MFLRCPSKLDDFAHDLLALLVELVKFDPYKEETNEIEGGDDGDEVKRKNKTKKKHLFHLVALVAVTLRVTNCIHNFFLP